MRLKRGLDPAIEMPPALVPERLAESWLTRMSGDRDHRLDGVAVQQGDGTLVAVAPPGRHHLDRLDLAGRGEVGGEIEGLAQFDEDVRIGLVAHGDGVGAADAQTARVEHAGRVGHSRLPGAGRGVQNGDGLVGHRHAVLDRGAVDRARGLLGIGRDRRSEHARDHG